VTFAAENSNKFQKTRFWKEKPVQDMVTLGPMANATLVVINTQLGCLSPNLTFQKKKKKKNPHRSYSRK
jgi:hypothetical protein